MPDSTQLDPESIATELSSKLSARARHVCLLMGAGAGRAAGLPDLAGLKAAILEGISEEFTPVARKLIEQRGVEATISYLRRLAAILEDGEELCGLTREGASTLNVEISQSIVPALDLSNADLGPYIPLASWLSGEYYHLPIEVFTLNYDLLLEAALERIAVPYFDGFVGTLKARFRPEMVDDLSGLPSHFVRLWKLHGSVNWSEELREGHRRVVRLGAPAPEDAVAAIYPSDEKYDESRRVPFVVLMDRFRRALETPETITIVTGYSFGDQHINELLFDAAHHHPRSEIVCLFLTEVPEAVQAVARSVKNITALGATEAIVGGKRAKWSEGEPLPGVWEDGSFLLGDFGRLAQYLATHARADHGAE